ncbi:MULTISPECIES: anthranilate synthase component II [unclassified Moraxella]|uniref:anthranilate synthase component II n=1 Tax=unclassified Moraxella TaxID=2685852 RepID=UPI003AF750F1
MILLIDNYDSFTYNIFQYLEQICQRLAKPNQPPMTVTVWQNDTHRIADIVALQPDYIVIGPGPCTPNEAGMTLDIIRYFAGKIPILGICLGHQAIGQAFGASVVRAEHIMHGRVSRIYHEQQSIFASLSVPFLATRYHSLVIDAHSLPSCLRVTAWTQDSTGERESIMGICHERLAVVGVQFHPESILSEYGHQLLQNFITQYAPNPVNCIS